MAKGKIIFSIIILLCLFPVTINAETISYNVCIPDSGAYSVTYDTEIATAVKRNEIKDQDILNKHIPYPDNITDEEKKAYEFSASRYSNTCIVNSEGEVETCPSMEQATKYPIYEKYGQNRDDYVKITLRENGNLNIKINALYDKGLYIRPVLDGDASRKLNTEGKPASTYSGQFLTAQNGYYYYNDVSGSTDTNVRFLTLEFYIKESGGCNGVYLGAVGISLPNPNTYNIANPALPENDPNNFYGCQEVKNYVPNGMKKDEVDSFLTPLKRSYIYECYNIEIGYGEKNGLKNTIANKLKNLQDMFIDYSGSTSEKGSGVCEVPIAPLTKTQTYRSTKGYWNMTCTETYNAWGSTPKLVKAGNGFKYQTNFSVTKTCKIYYVGPIVQWLPKCEYDCFHRCYWNSKSGVQDGWDGGPNEDFDQCILECDGGKYTQNCINSCYSNVYQNNRDVSFTDKFSLINPEQNKSIDRLTHDCVTEHDNNGNSASNECGQTYCVSDFCKENGWCENYKTKKNSPCTDDDPHARYNGMISDIRGDVDSLTKIQKDDISVGTFKYQITDSYLKTASDKKYKFTVDSTKNPKLSVKKDRPKDEIGNSLDDKGSSASVPIGSEGETASYNSSWFRGVNVTVNLPLSYVDKVTSTSVYKTNENNSTTDAYSVNHLRNRLDSVTDFTASKYYHDTGERKYYTNVFSKNINVVAKDNTIQLIHRDYVKNENKNITVTNSNVGNSDFSSTIKCYYGVYNDIYSTCEKDDLDCPCDPDEEICDGGMQYVYRPIDLTNIFPGDVNSGEGRDPRWNWTGTVTNNESTGAALTAKESLYGNNQTVDPEKLIQDIESKGEDIYDVSGGRYGSSEIDYEFVLTRENIRNIRKYNASVRDYNGDCNASDASDDDNCRNYLDYNMSCYYDTSAKREVCTSRFMDNINGNSGTNSADKFISYESSSYGYNITNRKTIAGCNNAINGNQCDYFK